MTTHSGSSPSTPTAVHDEAGTTWTCAHDGYLLAAATRIAQHVGARWPTRCAPWVLLAGTVVHGDGGPRLSIDTDQLHRTVGARRWVNWPAGWQERWEGHKPRQATGRWLTGDAHRAHVAWVATLADDPDPREDEEPTVPDRLPAEART